MPLTVPELKKLLRQSLDREKLLDSQLKAALEHVNSLEDEIAERKTAKAVDTERIENLEKQKAQAATEVGELRAAVTDLRATIATTRAALDNAEKEVIRQKEKVKAANKRTLWALVGGAVIGALAVLAAQK